MQHGERILDMLYLGMKSEILIQPVAMSRNPSLTLPSSSLPEYAVTSMPLLSRRHQHPRLCKVSLRTPAHPRPISLRGGWPDNPLSPGQISTTLTSLSRTLDDYSALSRNELDPAQKEKAQERLKSFRAELTSYRAQFDHLKKEREAAVTLDNRSELLGRRPHHTATPENPYSQQSHPAQNPWAPSHGQVNGGLSFGAGSGNYDREQHALREQNFFATANSSIDEFLDRGRAVLGELGQNREMLKGTQKRLYSVANTLGISGDTIRMVERRAKQDKLIFWIGVLVFFLFCFIVVHYLR